MADVPKRYCKFCGREIEYEQRPLGGRIFEVALPCQCDGAIAARANREAELERQRLAEIEERRRNTYLRVGIPRKFVDIPADSTYLDHVLNGGQLYYVGDTHQGKTYAACALLKAYIDKFSFEDELGNIHISKRAKFVCMPDLLSKWRASFDGGDDEEDVTEPCKMADILVLDDLGKGAMREWSLERIFDIVNSRYHGSLVTVVTTQYEVADLGSRMASGSDMENARAIVARLTDNSKRILVSNQVCYEQ